MLAGITRCFASAYTEYEQPSQFRSILDHYGLSTSDEEFSDLVKTYDRNGDGSIAYSEFNDRLGKLLYPEYNETWVKWSEKKGRKVVKSKDTTVKLDATAAEKALADKMFNKFGRVQKAFRLYDTDKSGSIDTSGRCFATFAFLYLS